MLALETLCHLQNLHELKAHGSSLENSFIKKKANDLLWQYDSQDKKVYLIWDGAIQLHSKSKNNFSRCLGVFGPKEVIGLAPFVEGRAHRSSASIASRSAHLIEIVMPSDKTELSLRADYALWTQQQLLLSIRHYIDQIEILSLKKIEERMKKLLFNLADRFAKKNEKNEQLIIPFRISKTKLASIVNARIETTIRLLNSWENQNLIEFEAHQTRLSRNLNTN